VPQAAPPSAVALPAAPAQSALFADPPRPVAAAPVAPPVVVAPAPVQSPAQVPAPAVAAISAPIGPAAVASEAKYVVWGSAPAEAPRTGSEEP
jgi:hypothetical protein